MISRYASHPQDYVSYDTSRIRKEFLADQLVEDGRLNLIYTHYDRFIFGTAQPTKAPIELGNYEQLKASYFLQRRELGVINLAGDGVIIVDGTEYKLAKYDCLYVGRGAQKVIFNSNNADEPALFYLNSCPAHKEYPTTLAHQADANRVDLGSKESCNERTIFQYIHEDGVQSCQLVMGYTELASGSIWNTFPPHTHERRMEVYFYFDVPEDQVVLHLMGRPDETRHIVMKNYEAVISPEWSIHSGAGTMAYKFVWGMGGENQSFTDMDGISLNDMK
ncbi:MAG: 5-dehydro-4-deoxy-D-glucuronate isomerase [Cyclobacteriaceae bacterium]